MKEFFKKYGWVILLIFSLTLIITYCIFAPKGFIPTGDVDKNAWLSFWGGFLAFFGTVFLGLVTLWQNENSTEETKRANNISEKLAELTQKANDTNIHLFNIENSRYSCNIILRQKIEDLEVVPLSNEGDTYEVDPRKLYFNIINHGDAVLKEIKICFPNNNIFYSHINLAKGEHRNVSIEVPKNLDCKAKINIIFLSCNDLSTYGDFILVIERMIIKLKYYHFYGLRKREDTSNL